MFVSDMHVEHVSFTNSTDLLYLQILNGWIVNVYESPYLRVQL